ncbi:hypothetical protein [Acidiphilium acidophilum]|uniref:Uncharacterized protein n=1 Tax=Acidiphilium acidophilum TaxID=76588 RepID=A0AAW9DRP7_ACIAO|nr:hypothetical protein [Acidiphilium acidophilum]MDX5931749.1 hypothetical protein [Acidiphilium acidophilum]
MTTSPSKPRKPGLFRRAARAEMRFFNPFIAAGRDTKSRLTTMSKTLIAPVGEKQHPQMRIAAVECYNKILLSFALYGLVVAFVLITRDYELASLLVPATIPLVMGVAGLLLGRRPGQF